jgi:hypothetical protein
VPKFPTAVAAPAGASALHWFDDSKLEFGRSPELHPASAGKVHPPAATAQPANSASRRDLLLLALCGRKARRPSFPEIWNKAAASE